MKIKVRKATCKLVRRVQTHKDKKKEAKKNKKDDYGILR